MCISSSNFWKKHIFWKDFLQARIAYEPLDIIAADDPITCAIYVREKSLLDELGWVRFWHLANCKKQLLCLVEQAKMQSFKATPCYKFGYPVPCTYNEALQADLRNGIMKWQDTTKLEMEQLQDYECLKDCGIYGKDPPPKGYKKIRVHLVFDIKHDACHKARCVADGHLTDVPINSIYSGVVSLHGLHTIAFLSELNDLEMWATNIGHAYLEAFTSEKLYVITGPEFGELEGHMLVISKALYGLRTSRLSWYERGFLDCLHDMGFTPSKVSGAGYLDVTYW